MRPNSIRLRLGQSEVRQLLATGRFEQQIIFDPAGDVQLRYALELGDGPTVAAIFQQGRITVTLPRQRARAWSDSDEIGIEAFQEAAGGSLRILIEKDFACVEGSSQESQADAFTNPSADACGPRHD